MPSTPLRIAFVGQPEYFRSTYENDLAELGEVREFRYNFSMTTQDFVPLIEFAADFNFFFRGEYVPTDVLRLLKGTNINLSSEPFPRLIEGRIEYTFDSINRYTWFRDIRNQPYDYVFHYEEASLALMARDGLYLSGEFVFPVAINTYRHTKQVPLWDIFFIGRSTEHRERFFGPLKHYFNFLHICHGVWGPALVDYLNAAKICLNVHAEDEVSWEPRMQMMLATGAFVISERITPNRYLRPGVDYVEVETRNEMLEAVRYYLENDVERERIAISGMNRVHEVLSSRACFQDLIRNISGGRCPRFRTEKGKLLLDFYSTMLRKWYSVRRLVTA